MNIWQQSNGGTNGRKIEPPIADGLEQRNKTWARRWFAGQHTCPQCGSDDFHVIKAYEEEDSRFDTYICNEPLCVGLWEVHFVAVAICPTTVRDPNHDWIEVEDVVHSAPDEAP